MIDGCMRPVPATSGDGEGESSQMMQIEAQTTTTATAPARASSPPALTDANGHFEIRGLGHAPYDGGRRGAGAASCAAARSRVKPDATITIAALGLTKLRGTVHAGGRLGLFSVELDGPTHAQRSFAAADGNVRARARRPGRLHVRVTSSAGNGEAKVTVVADQPATVDITLVANAIVTGKLVDATGKPVAGHRRRGRPRRRRRQRHAPARRPAAELGPRRHVPPRGQGRQGRLDRDDAAQADDQARHRPRGRQDVRRRHDQGRRSLIQVTSSDAIASLATLVRTAHQSRHAVRGRLAKHHADVRRIRRTRQGHAFRCERLRAGGTPPFDFPTVSGARRRAITSAHPIGHAGVVRVGARHPGGARAERAAHARPGRGIEGDQRPGDHVRRRQGCRRALHRERAAIAALELEVEPIRAERHDRRGPR